MIMCSEITPLKSYTRPFDHNNILSESVKIVRVEIEE